MTSHGMCNAYIMTPPNFFLVLAIHIAGKKIPTQTGKTLDNRVVPFQPTTGIDISSKALAHYFSLAPRRHMVVDIWKGRSSQRSEYQKR
jgi:hypothetical protein